MLSSAARSHHLGQLGAYLLFVPEVVTLLSYLYLVGGAIYASLFLMGGEVGNRWETYFDDIYGFPLFLWKYWRIPTWERARKCLFARTVGGFPDYHVDRRPSRRPPLPKNIPIGRPGDSPRKANMLISSAIWLRSLWIFLVLIYADSERERSARLFLSGLTTRPHWAKLGLQTHHKACV